MNKQKKERKCQQMAPEFEKKHKHTCSLHFAH